MDNNVISVITKVIIHLSMVILFVFTNNVVSVIWMSYNDIKIDLDVQNDFFLTFQMSILKYEEFYHVM